MEEILFRLKKLREQFNIMLERREDLQCACQRVTVRYDSERVSGGKADREEMLVALADYDKQIEMHRAKLAAAEKKLETLLEHFADVSPLRTGHRDSELLRLWYLEELPLSAIRDRMEQKGYAATDKTLRNWHTAALKRLSALRTNH